MAIIALSDVNHYFGDSCILRNASLSVEKHQRIGLVGRNGSGKTTLLDIISGRLVPSEGDIHRQRGVKISYLYQSLEKYPASKTSREESGLNQTVLLSYVTRSHRRVFELQTAIDTLLKKISSEPNPKDLELLDKYERELTSLDGYNLETKAKAILQRLAFKEADWNRPVDSFSGGEQTRIQLAAALLAPANLYLFDEPTNHLDIKMRDWLEGYLQEVKVPYIIVSHDRYFLDKTTNTICHLDNKNITCYSGNYSFFEQEYLRKKEQQQKVYEAQQTYIEKTKYFIRKNIAGQKTKQAKSRRKALEKLELIDRPVDDKKLNLSIETEKRSGNIVFTFDNVSFGFPDKLLAADIEKTVYFQDRIALLGENGCGKTTFLQVMAGEINPLAGKVHKGASLSVGYYDQMHIKLDHSLTVAETISANNTKWTKHEVMSYLARYGFYLDELEKNVRVLSGGEKARLYLALLITRKPNLLIMDEPTNHLDIPMIKSLEQALRCYDGTVIFVSHDRLFINNIATRFWLFNNNRIIEPFEWEKELLESFQNQQKSGKKTVKKQLKSERQRKVNPQLLELKLENISSLEKSIAAKETELSETQMSFSDSKTMKNPEKVKELKLISEQLKQEISSLKQQLSELEEDYLSCL